MASYQLSKRGQDKRENRCLCFAMGDNNPQMNFPFSPATSNRLSNYSEAETEPTASCLTVSRLSVFQPHHKTINLAGAGMELFQSIHRLSSNGQGTISYCPSTYFPCHAAGAILCTKDFSRTDGLTSQIAHERLSSFQYSAKNIFGVSSSNARCISYGLRLSRYFRNYTML